MRGGYKLISLENKNIVTGSTATIDDIYERIENSNRKPLVLTGIVIDGVEYNDCGICPVLNGTSYTFTAWGKTYTVTDADKVSFA